MKKIKFAFIIIAIVGAIGTAVATRPCQACTYSEQFYYTTSGYVPAGHFAEDYYCLQYGGVCTYYRPFPISQPYNYIPCRAGQYTPIP